MKKQIIFLFFALCVLTYFGNVTAFAQNGATNSSDNTIVHSIYNDLDFSSNHLSPSYNSPQNKPSPTPETEIKSADTVSFDPWHIVGIAAAAVGFLVIVVIVVWKHKKKSVTLTAEQPLSTEKTTHQSKVETSPPTIAIPTTTTTKICPRCEKAVEHDAAFCGYCGKALW